MLAIGAGAIFGVNITLNAASLEHISVIIGQALIATIPVWVAILEVTLLKGLLNRSIWIGVAVALAGGILISRATAGEPPIMEGGDPGSRYPSRPHRRLRRLTVHHHRSQSSRQRFIYSLYLAGLHERGNHDAVNCRRQSHTQYLVMTFRAIFGYCSWESWPRLSVTAR